MLLIVFRSGDDRFAIDGGRIVEILPLVGIRRSVGMPAGIRGSFNYHGRFVPVVDMSERLVGRRAEERLSTRVAVTTVAGEAGPLTFGLIIEHATGTLRCTDADLVAPMVANRERAWLGMTVVDGEGPIQLIDPDKLLAGEAFRSLAAAPAEVA